MAIFEGKTPAERNKMIFAIVLGVLAVFALAYGSGLFSGSSPTMTNANRRRTTARSTTQVAVNTDDEEDAGIDRLLPINFDPPKPSVPAVGRNIFAYYVAPVNTSPSPGAAGVASVVAPSPPPTPPLLLTSASTPGGVYARTGDFTLDVSGDKFTPETRVYLDNQDVPTQFVSAQQLKANVPASFIAAAGTRQVMARTLDGTLYSNSATLNVMAPPAPTHTYVGVIGTKRYNDKAILKDQKGDLVTVQLGDLVGGRFRVTGISERSVEFTDQQLKIRHTVNFTEAGRVASPAASSSYSPPSPMREIRPASPRTSPQPAKKDGDEDDEETDEP